MVLFRILRVPFTGSVKLRALLLKTGPTDHTPSKVALVIYSKAVAPYRILQISCYSHALFQFANEGNLDFEDDKVPTQEFDVPQSAEVGEYAVKYVSSIICSLLCLLACYMCR
jgi:hypothetical protein